MVQRRMPFMRRSLGTMVGTIAVSGDCAAEVAIPIAMAVVVVMGIDIISIQMNAAASIDTMPPSVLLTMNMRRRAKRSA